MFARAFFVSFVLLSFTACAPSIVRYYEGPDRALDKVAILYHNTEQGIKIFDIDDKSVQNRITTFNPDGWSEVHLEPGVHTLSGGLYLGNKHAIFRQQYKFEPGKKYRLTYDVNDISSKVRFNLQRVE
jgi:hypothetical protein